MTASGQPKLNLAPLNGIRAIACVAVVYGHCMFLQGFTHPDRYMEWYSAMEQHPWVLALVNLSEPAMDTFLVISSFLAAHKLLPALTEAASPRQAVIDYWKGRFWRIVPTYYATLAFVRFAFLRYLYYFPAIPDDARTAVATLWFNPKGGCPELLWVNLLFMNNQITRAGCMSYAWSQAVQVQFFVFFPLVLLLLRPKRKGFERRIAVAAILTIFVASVYRGITSLKFELPAAVFGPLEDPAALARMSHMMDTSYTALTPRLTHLSMGVLASVLLQHPTATAKLRSPRACALAAAAASLLFLTLFANRFGPYPDPTHPLASPAMLLVGAAGVTGFLQPASFAFLLAFAVAAPSGSTIRRILGSRAWEVVSDVSYDVYLLHPMVVLGVWTVFPPSTWFHVTNPSPWAFIGVSTLVLGASVIAAYAHAALWTRLLAYLGMTPTTKRMP